MLLLQKMFGMLEDIQHLIGLHNNLTAVKADRPGNGGKTCKCYQESSYMKQRGCTDVSLAAFITRSCRAHFKVNDRFERSAACVTGASDVLYAPIQSSNNGADI